MQNTIQVVQKNKLRCNIEKTNQNSFFSLVDYRNNLFTSNDPKKIIEFYNGFESRYQLIQWMMERPKGASCIHEVEGDKEIIVVIPTADFNGKYAMECRENIFKGLHIIFVESGVRNYYFNYAHNCNVGIRKAMEYNPKWIVVSNDDMYRIDSVDLLLEALSRLDNIDVVYTKPSLYHSVQMKVAIPNVLFYMYYMSSSSKRTFLSLARYFSIKYFPVGNEKIKTIFFKRYIKYIDVQDFIVLSRNFVKINEASIYDETFINHGEDTDLSMRITIDKIKATVINYKIGDCVGSTLGMGNDRKLRSIANLAYFTTKWDNKLHEKM